MIRHAPLFSALLVGTVAGASAFGAQPSPSPLKSLHIPKKNPCTQDIQKYCSDKIPGTGDLARCMKGHASELSAGCKSFGKKIEREHPELKKKYG